MVVCFIDIPVTYRKEDGRSSTESIIAMTAAIRLGSQRECHAELISVGDGSGNSEFPLVQYQRSRFY